MIINSVLDNITTTPLIKLGKISNLKKGTIFAKMEYIQPGGSIKDRTALQIIKDAYQNEKLKEGQPVVEMSSGNMAAGLAVVCSQFNNPLTIVMPEGNSPERIKILRAMGTDVVISSQINGIKGRVTGLDIKNAIDVALNISRDKNAFYVDQFNNPSSISAHYLTTGPEIWNDLGPQLDIFVSVIGSGGTFIGTSKFLKEVNPEIKCIAVEPKNASILKDGKILNPKHIIQGTGYGLIPPHYDPNLVDDIITVSDDEVRDMTMKLINEEGLFVGYSSGANVQASYKLLDKFGDKPVNIATILCDTAYKYSDI